MTIGRRSNPAARLHQNPLAPGSSLFSKSPYQPISIDQARGDLYALSDDLEFLKMQLVRLPTRKELARAAVLDCPGGFLFSPRTHRSAGRPTASPTSCPKDSSSELPSGSVIRAT